MPTCRPLNFAFSFPPKQLEDILGRRTAEFPADTDEKASYSGLTPALRSDDPSGGDSFNPVPAAHPRSAPSVARTS